MSALPDWCEPLLDAPRMRAVDRWAIEQRGVPSLDLMERAGEGVARAVEQIAPDGLVTVVCGKGNNGGDGLVVARLLRAAARDVEVVCTAPPENLSHDARVNFERLSGQRVLGLDAAGSEAIGRAVVVVDALLGTGFEGTPRGPVAEAIEAVNAAGARIVSVDVPSGVDASTGEVGGMAVKADLTATFHTAKPGLWIHPGKDHAGEALVIDIGIPRGAPLATDMGLIAPKVLATLPLRASQSTKFTSGHVVVVGGSRGLTGAPAMAALACLRAGAGYVTACVPRSLTEILDVQLMEVMTLGLPEQEGSLVPDGLAAVLAALERARVLALGPGLGRADGAVALARELALEAPLALVLDADGLNAHAGHLAELATREAPTVLTPHAGELGRLLGIDSEEIQRGRLRYARAAAEQSGAVVVLKGDDTLVAEPGGRVAISAGCSPALATAGTGDVLTGTISALLAQGLDAFDAAACGVYMHAEAGREAARRQGSAEGVIATDVIAALPAARAGKGRHRRRPYALRHGPGKHGSGPRREGPGGRHGYA
jgi:ADP-dependent NAD(P)H-hydrate dehydratase / NAD(P)H-hydrate epimerase